MKAPRFSQDVRPVSELRERAGDIVKQVRASRRPVLLTQRGRGVAVLLRLEDYEALVDRVAFVAAVKEGAAAVAAGDVRSNREAMALLDSFGASDDDE